MKYGERKCSSAGENKMYPFPASISGAVITYLSFSGHGSRDRIGAGNGCLLFLPCGGGRTMVPFFVFFPFVRPPFNRKALEEKSYRQVKRKRARPGVNTNKGKRDVRPVMKALISPVSNRQSAHATPSIGLAIS